MDFNLPSDTDEDALSLLINELNDNDTVNGILLQLPIPSHLDENKILERISPNKDVDGFHPSNMGKLILGRPSLRPCTPMGIMEMLKSINLDINGKHAAIIGRSNIVGKPIAAMLLEKNATVTICHSRTKDISSEVNRADIVIAAVGKEHLVKDDWIKDGAVVIDVGINRGNDGKLKGDVDFDTVSKKAYAITPVPGGVGPMTIAMLMKNTSTAAKFQNNVSYRREMF